MDLSDHMKDFDDHYDPSERMLKSSFTNPGYHTNTATGTIVHATLPSTEYAVLLLERGGDADVARASEILDRIIGLQDTNPTNASYGIWSWLLEEPLDKMTPPDWNWADFIGARFAQIILRAGDRLAPDLVRRLREGLGHTAWSIFRRNVTPIYTNIAIMGGGVAAVAGQILGEPRLLDYGRIRMDDIVEFTALNEGFTEYNSPAYTIVALKELERILEGVNDPQVRESTTSLLNTCWDIISSHFHAPSQQWAGPWARTYTDRTGDELAETLAVRTGVEIQPSPNSSSSLWTGPVGLSVRPIPCPQQFVPRFTDPLNEPKFWRQMLIKRDVPEHTITGATWMSRDACLGTASFSRMNAQFRPLIAQWKTEAGDVAVLKLQFLYNDQPYATANVRVAQADNHAVAAASLSPGLGVMHNYFDHPADGVFPTTDLRLRIDLSASNAAIRSLGGGAYELSASPMRGVVKALPAVFDGNPIEWTTTKREDGVSLDAVCYSGPEKRIKIEDLGVVSIGFALSILSPSEGIPEASPSWAFAGEDQVTLSWRLPSGDLEVTMPKRPVETSWTY